MSKNVTVIPFDKIRGGIFMLYIAIPNCKIKTNIAVFYPSRIYYAVHYCLLRNRTMLNESWISIGFILTKCSYAVSRRKSKAYYDVIQVLQHLAEENFIELNVDFDSVTYSTAICVKLLDPFFPKENYTLIPMDDFETILSSSSSMDKNTLLHVYCYFYSYLYTKCKTRRNHPTAFFGSMSSVSEEIGLCSKTINTAFQELCGLKLILKHSVNKIRCKNDAFMKVPNIYVLNNEDAEREINHVLRVMKTKKYQNSHLNT